MPEVINIKATDVEAEDKPKSLKTRYAEWVDWNCNAVGYLAILLLCLSANLITTASNAIGQGIGWTELVPVNIGRSHPLTLTLIWACIIGCVTILFGVIAAISWIALKAGWLCD